MASPTQRTWVWVMGPRVGDGQGGLACCTSWEVNGETVEAVSDLIFGAPELLQMVIAAMKLRDTYSLEGKL